MQRIPRVVRYPAAGLWMWLIVGCAPRITVVELPPAVPPAAVPPPEIVGLPSIPEVEGPLAIRVVHPPPGQVRPNTDSVFTFGSVGTGRATLSINGTMVPVAPNGAFIAFLARPLDDVLRFRAWTPEEVAQAFASYAAPQTSGGGQTAKTVEYPVAQLARVMSGADTLATGSDVAIGRPTPTGTYRWFLPIGAVLTITGERADMIRARIDSGTDAWFPRNALAVAGHLGGVPIAMGPLGPNSIVSGGRWTDVRIPTNRAPFRVEARDSVLTVTVHGVQTSSQRVEVNDPTVALIEAQSATGDVAIVRIFPTRFFWGFKAFYQADGTLVIRTRRPPTIDRGSPLRGIRIAVDAGHPPGGATGPTGLMEADANLGIALRLAEQLGSAGAEVLMTRSTISDVALVDRVDMAVDWDADLLISVHNNAFPEGVNPFLRNGTSTYYFHPLSAGFARAMNGEIVRTTLIRDLGAIADNLALVRPTWMPAVLTESLFLPLPEQEAGLRDPAFLDALAAAHLRGIQRFLLERPAEQPLVGRMLDAQ